MDVVHDLAAKYCVRQNARGFIELWALIVALAGATFALLASARRDHVGRGYRIATFTCALVCAGFALLTAGFGSALLHWCYASAAASLGMTSSSGKHVDTLVCLIPHATELASGWILMSVSFVAAIALLLFGIFRLKSPLQKALTFAGTGAALIFAVANGGLMLFSISWCQSQRLF